MGKLIEEKALEQYYHGHHHHHHHDKHGFNNYSLEEKVSEFLDNDFDESDACLNATDGYGSDGNESNDPIQHNTRYWESQDALLQVFIFLFILLLFDHSYLYVYILSSPIEINYGNEYLAYLKHWDFHIIFLDFFFFFLG